MLALSQEKNGFDLSNATVPVSDILSGGPPRDGIPSIDRPKFETAAQADWLQDDDLVFGISIGDDQRAYPLRILVWHEIVNDVVGGQPVAITYCPLCGTAMAFDRQFGGKTLTFGVSGLLYQSDVLMYDRQTESLWSQLAIKSVSGTHAGTALRWLPGDLMTWKAWKEAHPDSTLLSRETGFSRNYSRMPYQGYEERPGTLFPVPRHRDELGNKEWVLGIIVDGKAIALPIKKLAALDGKPAVIQTGMSQVEVRYDPERRQATVQEMGGSILPSVQVYWFAWQAFYPGTVLWEE